MWKVYKPPLTKVDRSQRVSLTTRKLKFKLNLTEKKPRQMLLEKKVKI